MLFHTTGRNDIWNNTLHVTVWRRYKNIRWNNIENIDILPGGLDYTGRYKNIRWNNIKNIDILPARLDYTGIGIGLQQENRFAHIFCLLFAPVGNRRPATDQEEHQGGVSTARLCAVSMGVHVYQQDCLRLVHRRA